MLTDRVHVSNGMGIAVPVGWSLSRSSRGEFYRAVPETELIVVLHPNPLIAILVIAAVATVLFAILYSLLKRWI